jgi:hypothetical protein
MRVNIIGLLLSVISVPLFVTACVAGQTGSPSCIVPNSCVCEYFNHRIILKGTVARIDDAGTEVLVDELFNGTNLAEDMGVIDLDGGMHGPIRTADLVVGDVIGGSFDSRLPCGGPDKRLVKTNDKVLVSYIRGEEYRYPDCIEYKQCTVVKCNAAWGDINENGFLEWDAGCDNDCVRDTSEICAEHRSEALLTGKLWILSWEVQMLFGADKSIEAGQINALANPRICLQRFPPPKVPCDDVIESVGLCNTTNIGHPARTTIYAVLFMVFAIAITFRRLDSQRPAGHRH